MAAPRCAAGARAAAAIPRPSRARRSRRSSAPIGALYVDHRLKPGGFGPEGVQVAEALSAMAGAAVARGRAARALRAREDEAATLRALLEAARSDAGEPQPRPGPGPGVRG